MLRNIEDSIKRTFEIGIEAFCSNLQYSNSSGDPEFLNLDVRQAVKV